MHSRSIFVSYVPSFPPVGATSRVEGDLIKELLNSGLQVRYLQSGESNIDEYPKNLWSSITLVRLFSRSKHKTLRYFGFTLSALLTILKLRDYRKVVTIGPLLIPIGLVSRLFLRREWITILHDYEIVLREIRPSSGTSRRVTKLTMMLETLSKIANTVTLLNEDERSMLIERGFNPERILSIPIFPERDLMFNELRSTENRKQLVNKLGIDDSSILLGFSGSLRYEHNRVLLHSLCKDLFPALRGFQSVKFLIFGNKNVDTDLGSNVINVGFVEDLYLWISNLDLFVLPIETSQIGGMKGRVIDSIACSTPIITTQAALWGYESSDCPIICYEGPSLSDAVVKLVSDTTRLVALRAPTYQYYLKNYQRRKTIEMWVSLISA